MTSVALLQFKHIALWNAAVVCFQADGCMAHDHKFLWMGTVTAVQQINGCEFAVVQVIKRHDGHYSHPEHDLGQERVPINLLYRHGNFPLWSYLK